jgi:hypothetical protein
MEKVDGELDSLPYGLIEQRVFQTSRFNWTYSIARETEEPSSVVENLIFPSGT